MQDRMEQLNMFPFVAMRCMYMYCTYVGDDFSMKDVFLGRNSKMSIFHVNQLHTLHVKKIKIKNKIKPSS